jgi:hypothetical protein
VGNLVGEQRWPGYYSRLRDSWHRVRVTRETENGTSVFGSYLAMNSLAWLKIAW